MKIDKKKLVFIGAILLITMAMIAYWVMLQEESELSTPRQQTDVPSLSEQTPEYRSRLEAVDKVKEERERSIPSVYDEKFLDSQGSFDPYLEEREKNRLIDSILASGPQPEFAGDLIEENSAPEPVIATTQKPATAITSEIIPGSNHSRFFFKSAAEPMVILPEKGLLAMVDGDQVVQKNERLVLRLLEPGVIGRDSLTKHTRIYARCDFKENRLLLKVYSPNENDKKWEAYDLADGQPGVYVPNNFRAEATTEILNDVIQDINISGVPQVMGLRGLFQRSNRRVKVKVSHQYQLVLKPVL